MMVLLLGILTVVYARSYVCCDAIRNWSLDLRDQRFSVVEVVSDRGSIYLVSARMTPSFAVLEAPRPNWHHVSGEAGRFAEFPWDWSRAGVRFARTTNSAEHE